MSDLQSVFRVIEDTLRAKHGAELDREGFRPGANLGGSIDNIFDLSITNGHGTTSSTQKTWWVNIKGYFEIVSPAQGTWHAVVKCDDTVIIDRSGLTVNQQVPFEYKTGFSLTMSVDADWSIPDNTTLRVRVVASY